MSNKILSAQAVWDVPTRLFHWINALSVTALMVIGFIILNAKLLGISNDGKVLLKTVHVWIGYIFVVNLLGRVVWAFFGNRYARWRAILPIGPGYFRELRRYGSAMLTGNAPQYLGHNPLGRMGVAALLLLLMIQALTGLVLAGTDIFYPPIGHWIAEWVAAAGVDPATLVPYAKEMVDAKMYQEMRDFRTPFILIHEYNFYVLAGIILLHVLAVVTTEIREGGGLVSAMLTGYKIVYRAPVDKELDNSDKNSKKSSLAKV